MSRFATIDVGTNSVLLLVAERGVDNKFAAVAERAEITRLGRGVDSSRRLDAEAIADTLGAIGKFVDLARNYEVEGIAISATSAARDASNGHEFIDAVERATGVRPQIISGDEEAKLSFASAFSDFGGQQPLMMIDIGGGSTEFVVGDVRGAITFRHSFDVGSVRLTEAHIRTDPPAAPELAAMTERLQREFKTVPRGTRAKVVGVAGTVTTVFSVARRVEPYDSKLVHGAQLTLDEVHDTVQRLSALPVHLRRTVPGLQPKRADVIVAGGLILECAMRAAGVEMLVVSDRGLRWGLMADRFGVHS